jgi:putative endopeptidase
MRILCLLATALLLCGFCVAQNPAPASSAVPSFDANALDRTADPCVDFYQFACGGWMKNNPIPADQASWSRFAELAERNRATLHEILEQAADPKQKRTANQQKIGDYYASCMDEAAINKNGLAAFKPEFDRINALKSKSELTALIAHLHGEGIPALFGFGSLSDFKNAKMVIAIADQGGLSLPERDYYLRTGEKDVAIQKAYVEHVTNMFKLLGDSPEQAATEANAVMNIETALAKGSMEVVKRRDPANIYHKMSQQDWQALAPTLSFSRYLTDIGAPGVTELNVAAPDFFKALDAELRETSLTDLKTYLRWHLIHSQVEYLPTAFVNENFEFYGKKLSGAKELQARWKRCTRAVDGDLGEALGEAYVNKVFPPEAKARTLKMVNALEAALKQDITTLPWMSEATKQQAIIKLAAIQNKIGYPDHFRDYSTLKIVRGDALGNSLRSNQFEFRRELSKINKPLDKSEWGMTPPTVNAYYNPLENNINFPAGILQPPFYDFKADDALNFGAIGAVIGHELTHGFDDEGRQFDKDGNLTDWWTKQDADAFKERAQCLIDEYTSFMPLPDLHGRGDLTLGENTADNGGVRIALMALAASMQNGNKVAAELGSLSPEQRAFVGWGQIWCQNSSEQMARRLTLTNEHSLGRFRVNGVVQNMPEFQKAYNCKAGQPMVSAKPCRVW